MYTLIALFVNYDSPYTKLQKEENFEQYEGKWIKSSGLIMEVSDVALSDSVVVGIVNPANQYLRGASIYFDESSKSKLASMEKYSEISFEGKIEDYNSLLGIIIKDANLIS